MDSKGNKISIITYIGSVITEIYALIIWLIPTGFLIYPFICGFAVLLSVVSFMLSKGNKALRVLNFIGVVVMIISIVFDVIGVISLFLEL